MPAEKLMALNTTLKWASAWAGHHDTVRQFGGTIRITSDAAGTVVRVSIPVRNEREQNVSESPQQELRARGVAAGELNA